jgi:hypothetical protein
MRRNLLFVLAALMLGFVVARAEAAPPAGATARCSDGTYSFSQHRSGTCSHHGGVEVWLDGSNGSAPSSTPCTAGAASGATNAKRVAAALKCSMTETYETTVPGLRFGTVTCTLAKNLRSGQCLAHFTYTAKKIRGVYRVSATINPTTGGVRWRTTSVACTNLGNGEKIAC